MKPCILLQFGVCLAALSLVYAAPRRRNALDRLHRPSSGQMELLSMGQRHLRGDLENSERHVARLDSQVTEELKWQNRAVEQLHKEAIQVSKAHARMRRYLQGSTACGERVQMAAQELRDGVGALGRGNGEVALRLGRLLEVVLLLSGSTTQTQPHINMTMVKMIVDSQTNRLSNLTSRVMSQDRNITKYDKSITDLEQKVSNEREGKHARRP